MLIFYFSDHVLSSIHPSYTILNETNGNNEFTTVQISFLCFSFWVKIKEFIIYRWHPPRITYILAKNLLIYLWLENVYKGDMKQWPVWAVDIGAGLKQEADEEGLTGLAGKVEDVPTLVIHLISDLLLLKTTSGTVPVLSLGATLLEFHIFYSKSPYHEMFSIYDAWKRIGLNNWTDDDS